MTILGLWQLRLTVVAIRANSATAKSYKNISGLLNPGGGQGDPGYGTARAKQSVTPYLYLTGVL